MVLDLFQVYQDFNIKNPKIVACTIDGVGTKIEIANMIK